MKTLSLSLTGMLLFVGSLNLRAQTPLPKILADTQQFAGKQLTVFGFLHFDENDKALYMTKNDADFLIRVNALALPESVNATLLDKKGQALDALAQLHGTFVKIKATLSPSNSDDFSASLINIDSVEELPLMYSGKQKRGKDWKAPKFKKQLKRNS